MRYIVFFKFLLVLSLFLGCDADSGSRTNATTSGSQTQDISFTIEAATGAEISTPVTSADINITGISGSASASLDAGVIIKNGVDVGTSTTITASDTVAVKLISSGSYETMVSAYLTIGSVTRVFSVTTKAENLPDLFSFTSKTGASLSTAYISNEVTIAGLETNSTVTATLSSGTLIHNGSILSTPTTTIENGDTLAISLTSSSSYAASVTATLSIGSFSTTYLVTTVSQPTLIISPSSLSLSYGQTQVLSTSITPSSLDYNVSWSSGDSSVASIASDGTVTAMGSGATTITAIGMLSDSNISASINVTVSITSAIEVVQDFGSSDAHFTTAENDSFVDVVINSSDSKAFIATSIGVVIIDINSSSSSYMDQIAYVKETNNTEHIELTYDDSRLFAAAGFDGLASFDVSTPASTSILARYDSDYNSSSKYAWSVALSGNNVAYVANCAGVDVFNIASSASITKMDELNISGGKCTGITYKINKYDIVTSHNDALAYLAYGDQGVKIIDTLDPYNIEVNATYSDAGCTDARGIDISVDGKTIFVACGAGGVDIVDVGTEDNITKLAKYTMVGAAEANDVKLSSDGSKLLVTHGEGIDMLDVSDLTAPTAIATYSSVGNAYAAAFDSNDTYFYLSDDGNGMLKLQLVYQ